MKKIIITLIITTLILLVFSCQIPTEPAYLLPPTNFTLESRDAGTLSFSYTAVPGAEKYLLFRSEVEETNISVVDYNIEYDSYHYINTFDYSAMHEYVDNLELVSESTTTTISDTPPVGKAYFYLVRATNEETIGFYSEDLIVVAYEYTNSSSVHEPNNTRYSKYPIESTNIVLQSYIASADDTDYFYIPKELLTDVSAVTITLSNLPADYNMSVFDYTTTLTNYKSGTTLERIDASPLATGFRDIYIRIFSAAGAYDTSVPYSLVICLE